MLIINYICCNYLIQTTEQLKQTPIARGIHIQNISMTKGKKSENQKEKKRMNQTKTKKTKTRQNKKRKKKERKKQTNKTKTKNNPQHIYSARSGIETLYFPPENSL